MARKFAGKAGTAVVLIVEQQLPIKFVGLLLGWHSQAISTIHPTLMPV
jgi:hypothetical protein